MKRIRGLEKKLYKDIFFTMLWVLISIPLWLNFNVSASEAQYYDNYNFVKYEFLNNASKTINIYEDMDALRKCETQDILIYNDSNTLDDYSLILKINKADNLDLNNIKINVNYDVKYLNNYTRYDDANYYYYIIDKNEMVATSQKYIISMWGTNDYSNNQIDYEFMVL